MALTSSTENSSMRRAANAAARPAFASGAQTRPGIIANATQLHAVKVAASPATNANRKPNVAPSTANSPALPR
jgi:hypothetical protein